MQADDQSTRYQRFQRVLRRSVELLSSKGPLVFLLLFVAFMFYDPLVSDPQRAREQALLEQEFRAIQHPTAAAVTDYRANHKTPETTKVHVSFRTTLARSEVRVFYDAELSRLGWRSVGEHSRSVNGGTESATYYERNARCAGLIFRNGQMVYPGGYVMELDDGHFSCNRPGVVQNSTGTRTGVSPSSFLFPLGMIAIGACFFLIAGTMYADVGGWRPPAWWEPFCPPRWVYRLATRAGGLVVALLGLFLLWSDLSDLIFGG